MLLALRSAAPCRAAAAALVLVLSGAAGFAGALAPEPPHRCACRVRRGEAHRCSCPVCARQARLHADEAALEGLPPCHREAARRARAEDARREAEREARERARPGVREDCGREPPDPAAPGPRDTFVVPVTVGLAPPPPPARTPAAGALEARPAPAPELPPPRA